MSKNIIFLLFWVYLTKLTISQSQLDKDLEGSGSVLILFQYLPGGPDENYEKLWSE
jgi:hypothetical protein